MPFNNKDQQRIDQIYSNMRKDSMQSQEVTRDVQSEILKQGFKKIFADKPARKSSGLGSINRGLVVYHNPDTSELLLIDGTNRGRRGKTDRVQDLINFLYDDNNTSVTFGSVSELLIKLPEDLSEDLNYNLKPYNLAARPRFTRIDRPKFS